MHFGRNFHRAFFFSFTSSYLNFSDDTNIKDIIRKPEELFLGHVAIHLTKIY